MNVVVFCDIPCDRLSVLMRARIAELPLCGKPMLSYLLALISHSGAADQLWLVDAPHALQATAEQLQGIRVMHGAPPQTAQTDTLIVRASGLLDCDFSAALEHHRASGAEITVLTLAVSPESRIPRLRVEGERVCGAGRRSDRYADTGCAIVRAGVSLTPQLINLYAQHETRIFAETGFYQPIDSVESYLHCQKMMLGGWMEIGAHKRLDGVISPSTDSFPQAELQPPVYLGHRVRLGADTRIRESVICGGTTIGSGVMLDGCVVLDGAYIGDGVQAHDALICADAMLMHGCRLEPGSAVGEGASVGERAVVETQVRVFAGKRVAPRTTAELDVRSGSPQALSLEEDTVCGTLNIAAAMRLGSCAAQAGDSMLIGCADAQAAQTLAFAVCAGCTAAGANAILAADCTLPAACFASAQANTDLLLYIEAGAEVSLRLLGRGGLLLTTEQSEALERALDTRTAIQLPHDAFGATTQLDSANALYEFALKQRFPALRRADVSVSTANARLRRLGTQLFGGGAEHTGILLQLSSDGRQLSVYSDQTGFIRPERVQLLCCLAMLRREQRVAVPEDAPLAAEQLAERTGGTVLRCKEGADGATARDLALVQRFTLDGLYAAGILLEYLAAEHLTLEAAVEQIPKIHCARRILPTDAVPQRILHRVCGAEPMYQSDARGILSFRPSRSGKTVTVYTEAASMEAAEELFAEAERLLGK